MEIKMEILFCLAVLVWCIKEGTSQMPDHGPIGRTINRAALFTLGVCAVFVGWWLTVALAIRGY